jgi:hypothetical protein
LQTAAAEQGAHLAGLPEEEEEEAEQLRTEDDLRLPEIHPRSR